MALPDLSTRAARTRSSAVRDILRHARRPGVISLAGGIPAPETFPLDMLGDAVDAAMSAGVGALQYGLTAGEEQARSVFAAWSGVDPVPTVDEVVVTTGSQQGIELITRTFVDPGDVVVVAAAEYLGALQVFRSHDATIHAVPIDNGGLAVDALAERLAGGLRPKLVYTVPNHHNPTGATLVPERAAALTELAERHGFLVVEDDPYRELGGPPTVIGPGSANVVRLRSVSKVLAPGLRCAWLVGAPAVVDAVAVAKQSVDLHTSTLSQAIAAHALADPRFPAHLDTVRRHYTARRRDLAQALHAEAGHLRFDEPTGGMFLWATGAGVDTADLLPVALDAGVAYVPGAVFDPTGVPSNRLRLSFATASGPELRTAALILGKLTARSSEHRSGVLAMEA